MAPNLDPGFFPPFSFFFPFSLAKTPFPSLSALPFFHTFPSVLISLSSNFFLSLLLNLPPFFLIILSIPFNSAPPFFFASLFSFSLSNHVLLGLPLISSSCTMIFSPLRTSISACAKTLSSFSSFNTSSISSSISSTLSAQLSASAASITLLTILAPCARPLLTAALTILRSGSAANVHARPVRPARAVRPTL